MYSTNEVKRVEHRIRCDNCEAHEQVVVVDDISHTFGLPFVNDDWRIITFNPTAADPFTLSFHSQACAVDYFDHLTAAYYRDARDAELQPTG